LTTSVAIERSYWLKMVGASDYRLEDHWIEQRPELLRGIRAPRQPSGINRGDRLVYYSAGTQKLFAIARAKENGSDAAVVPGRGEDRWPYLLEVQLLLIIPQLALAPDWTVLDLPSTTVTQKSYVEITPEKYEIAHRAMFERTARPSQA
jgi:hypothetical protein